MEISFATEALKQVCLAREPKGVDLPMEVTRALHALYNAMRNADHIGELPLGQPGPDELRGGHEWRVDLGKGYGVVMCVNHTKPPLKDDSIDWARVYRVQVIAIEVPHA
jgi:hypothetical protein